MTKVSVIIPAYNQAQYLRGAIQSVLNQTYEDFEILVVDDGSTDNTSEVVANFDDDRIRYINQDNRGLSGARNTGIHHSTGCYLTFLDSDDLFHQKKLAILTSILDEDSNIGFVAGGYIQIDEGGNVFGKADRNKLSIERYQSRLLFENPIFVGSVMLRHSWIEKVGYFDEDLHAYEDWDMWLRLIQSGCKFKFIEDTVAYYRFHKSQMTREPERMKAASFTMLDKLYKKDNLPEPWVILHDQAYSHAYLRAAAQAYRVGQINSAKLDMSEAVKLNPELGSNEAELLSKFISAWADDPRTGDPIKFFKLVYDNLPEGMDVVSKKRNIDLGRLAMRYAYEAYGNKDYDSTRVYLKHVLQHQPRLLLNRGVLSIFVKSWL